MSGFKEWYKEFETHRQFPMSIEANQLYVAEQAYEAGRKDAARECVEMVEQRRLALYPTDAAIKVIKQKFQLED